MWVDMNIKQERTIMGLHYERSPQYRCPPHIIQVNLGILIRDLPWEVGAWPVYHSGIVIDNSLLLESVEELSSTIGGPDVPRAEWLVKVHVPVMLEPDFVSEVLMCVLVLVEPWPLGRAEQMRSHRSALVQLASCGLITYNDWRC
jgi:hypothetical protein